MPGGTLLPPAQFVTAAERAGLSSSLTRRMLGIALAELRGWRASGHDVFVCVNTAVADLLDTSFPAEVAEALLTHHLPADALVLQVTETSIMSNPERAGQVLRRLREFGVQVALDDFGTGYSSLTHPRTLSLEQIKIDRSFVGGMCDQPADAAIVYATVELAHKLGLRVVAEGVEDRQTWQALRDLGCEAVQGFALARPLPAAEFRREVLEAAASPDPDAVPDSGQVGAQGRRLLKQPTKDRLQPDPSPS